VSAGEDGWTALEPATRRALEAVLFAAEEPVEPMALAQVLEIPTEQVSAALHAYRRRCVDEERGFVLRETDGAWRLYTDPSAAPYVERFVLAGRSGRLSQQALETLAIIAWKQPVTRSEVSEIRGVDVDGAVRSLVSRGLVEEVGRDPSPGQPLLYGTTPAFLERLGLAEVADLPALPSLVPAGPLPQEPAPGQHRAARLALASAATGGPDLDGDPDLDEEPEPGEEAEA
jgi:segregation and condensation protein B